MSGAGAHIAVIAQAFQDRRFIPGCQIDDVDEGDGVLFTRVVAALEYGEIQQLGGFDAQAFDDRLAQGRRGQSRGSASSEMRITAVSWPVTPAEEGA